MRIIRAEEQPPRLSQALARIGMALWADRLHWSIAIFLITFGIIAGKDLNESARWSDLRYHVYQWLQKFDPRDIKVERTVLVLIGDEEYWKGDLARRSPIKRDYLARLIEGIDAANPAVIVLDFDLRSPVPDGSLRDHKDYATETEALLTAIRDVSQRRPVVLPATINFDGRTEKYYAESTIYDNFDFKGGQVARGYIELPYDLRQLPLPRKLRDGTWLDSLSSGIVLFDQPRTHQRLLRLAAADRDTLPFGSFAGPKEFTTFTADQVLHGHPDATKSLAHKIVLVGAGWSRFAYHRGGPVEVIESPIGLVGRVFLHANYAEALLDRRMRSGLPVFASILLEVAFSLAVAILFHAKTLARVHLTPSYKMVGFSLLWLLLFLVTYIFWLNLGVFFDFFIPLILLPIHGLVEKILGWRAIALAREAST